MIDLASGSQIIFAGHGTGETDSWAELLPPQAEDIWSTRANGRAPDAAQAARAIEAELARLPRDH